MTVAARSQNNLVFDAENQLQSRETFTVFTGEPGSVDGVARVLDFGRLTEAGELEIAYTRGTVVVDVADFNFGALTIHSIIWQLSTTESFAGGVVVNRQATAFGLEGGLFSGSGATSTPSGEIGQIEMRVDNEWMSSLFRFARIMLTDAGGIAGNVTYEAFFSLESSRRA